MARPPKPEILWVLVHCTSNAEARRIGEAALAARRASCYDLFRRTLARYFWPPQAGRVEEARGALLVLETLPARFAALAALVRQHHRDRLPFVGALRVEGVAPAYVDWVRGELSAGAPRPKGQRAKGRRAKSR